MLVIRRKNIIIGLLVILLIVTGYLNFWFNQSSTPAANPEKDSPSKNDLNFKPNNENQKELDYSQAIKGGKVTITDIEEPEKVSGKDENGKESISVGAAFFRDYRFEREQERGKVIEYINTVVNHTKSDPELIKEAQAQLLEITSNMEAELAMENLIKAKGFRDAIVIIHKDNVSVIVDKSELVPEEVAMILDIVKRESGKITENIKIIPKV